MNAITPPDAVLCIPGRWTDIAELGKRIIHDSGGYLFVGRLLIHLETKTTFELQFEDADPRMASAFAAAGRHWAGTPAMDEIASHTSVVYLIGKCGSQAGAEALMLAGGGLLKAGGLGVKVESSGIAHSPDAWRGFAAECHLFKAHSAFVVYVTGNQVYSCGMHHFGLPDAMVEGGDASENAELLRIFTFYLFTEQPTIHVGQTFSTAADAPVFRIVAGVGADYGSDSLFHNPYGTWQLAPLGIQAALAKTEKWFRRLLH